jgi:putative CRISPR-associated protein (TIGR02619 family)
MQIIMTVGTSLKTNRDSDLLETKRRPWIGEKQIGEPQRALWWMEQTDMELISAETNTFWRLDPQPTDEIILLYSDTLSGLECAEILKLFFEIHLGQQSIQLRILPGVNYDLEESGSALDQMATQLRQLIEMAREQNKQVTLAATGGFKAQTIIMSIMGNQLGVPVCYVHEDYRALIYLPYIAASGQLQSPIYRASLPDSGRARSDVIHLQASKQGHHRPKAWQKVAKLLATIPWVDNVYYEEKAFSAPKNGVKIATKGTTDGCHILWLHLYESDDSRLAVAIETTGYSPEHIGLSSTELRERLGRLL